MTLDISKKHVGFVTIRMKMEDRSKDICQVPPYALWLTQVSMRCIPVSSPQDGNPRDVPRQRQQNRQNSHPLLHVVLMVSLSLGAVQPLVSQGPSLE